VSGAAKQGARRVDKLPLDPTSGPRRAAPAQQRLDLARGVLFLRARGAIRAPAAWNAP
jgi:hypothetical protein